MSSEASDRVYYPGLIPEVTCLTVLEEDGNLQKSASVGVELRTGTKALFSELENLGGGAHQGGLTLALCYPDTNFLIISKIYILKMFTP